MSDQNIELSKEGIKISYLRFLSDSAAGQIVILVAIAAYYFPIFGSPLQQATTQIFSTEVKILVIVLLILLSSPLGLAVNAMSWFFLSWLQVGLQRLWFKKWRLFGNRRVLFKHFQNRTTIHPSIGEQVSHSVTPAWLAGKLRAGGRRNNSCSPAGEKFFLLDSPLHRTLPQITM